MPETRKSPIRKERQKRRQEKEESKCEGFARACLSGEREERGRGECGQGFAFALLSGKRCSRCRSLAGNYEGLLMLDLESVENPSDLRLTLNGKTPLLRQSGRALPRFCIGLMTLKVLLRSHLSICHDFFFEAFALAAHALYGPRFLTAWSSPSSSN